MMMPAISPDGRRVAVAAYGNVPDQALIFTLDLATDAALPGPPATLPGAQLLPRWLDDDTLVYVQLGASTGGGSDSGGGSGGTLMRWTLGGSSATPIAPLTAPGSVFDAQHLFAAIARPVSPDGELAGLPEPRRGADRTRRHGAVARGLPGRGVVGPVVRRRATELECPRATGPGRGWWGERWLGRRRGAVVAADDRRIGRLVELA